MLLALALGIVTGLESGNRKTLLASNVVFRLAMGMVAFAVVYLVVPALWFAWHRRTFKGIRLAGSGADALEQLESETNARDSGGSVGAVKRTNNRQKARAHLDRMRELTSSVAARNQRIRDLRKRTRRSASARRPSST